MCTCSHILSLMGVLSCVCKCGDTYSFLIHLQTSQASAVIISVFQLDPRPGKDDHTLEMSALMTYNSDVTFLLMVSLYMLLVEDFGSKCCRSEF